MTTTPTFYGVVEGRNPPVNGSFTPTIGEEGDETTLTYGGSSVPVGSTVAVTFNGLAMSGTYEGSYITNGVEYPLVLLDSGYYSGTTAYFIFGQTQYLYFNNQTLPVSYPITSTDFSVPCYCQGTSILTPRGEVAVETLTIGDLLVTTSGAHRPIRWIGHRTLDCRTHIRPEEAHPVRIARHAFGANKPARDLYVSRGHWVCVDVLGEVLISAYDLINGTTISQVEVDHVTYWHIELESHDILIANGLPAESYRDMGNRHFFIENSIVGFDMAPDADLSLRAGAEICRPFIDGGPVLDAVRHQLRRRAETLGWVLDTSQPMAGLHLVVDGRRIDPVVRGLTARFAMPESARDVWLVSTMARPIDLDHGDDVRQLGVFISGLTLYDGLGEPRIIAMDDPRLCAGFYGVEEGCRQWTAGRARLPASLWDGLADDFFLRVDLDSPALPRWTQLPRLVADQTPKRVRA